MLNHNSYLAESNLSVVLHALCDYYKSCGMLIKCIPSDEEPSLDDWAEAVPWLDRNTLFLLSNRGFIFLFFKDLSDMSEAWRKTRTKKPDDGSCYCYAEMNSYFRK